MSGIRVQRSLSLSGAKERFAAFFKELGNERCAKLEAVTLDMSTAYLKAVTEATPEARVIFDRFHVQRLAHDALDEVRREPSVVRRVGSTSITRLGTLTPAPGGTIPPEGGSQRGRVKTRRGGSTMVVQLAFSASGA